MGFISFGAIYRKLCFMQGRRMHNNVILWVTLTAWITSAAAQGVQPGCNVSLTGSGSILSPNYPSDYPNNINCTWRLQSSSTATSIRLKFNSFITESTLDTLRIYDEKGVVTLFSGSQITPIVILGRTALLVFTTDYSVTHQGFNASFTSFDTKSSVQCTNNDVYWCINSRQCISRSWLCDNQLDCLQGEDELGCSATNLQPSCNVLLTGSGSILSPNYPSYYPNNMNCTWRLLSSSNATSIRLKFNSFSTESNIDFLRVYDEKGIVTLFSGSQIPPIATLGRAALLVFTTDFLLTSQGFNASVISFDTRNISQCTTNDVYWCTNSRQCISYSWRCDNQRDCSNGEDELSCPPRATTTTVSPQYDCLRYGEFWCSRSSQCVSMLDRCDNYNDCMFGEDEANCPTTTTTNSPQSECLRYGKFWCSRSSRCVPTSYRCDNYNDCTYGEDEAYCSNVSQPRCQQDQRFWCGTSRQCINSLLKCDRTNDCTYGEDEDGCAYLTTGTITGIVVGCVFGVVLLVLLVVGLLRARQIRRLRSAIPRSNNYLLFVARPAATVYSTSATYASQFGAPNRQPGGPPGTGGLPMDQYAPPSYDATITAHATGQYAYPPAQSRTAQPPSNALSTAQPAN